MAVLSCRIWGPLPKGKFMSFFSLLKHIFEPLHDQKGELNKVSVGLKSLDLSFCWLFCMLHSGW